MLTVELHRSWNEALWRTDTERPLGAAAALIGWTADPAPVDEGPPTEIKHLISEICVSSGAVAFRLFFDCDLSESAAILRAPRKSLPIRVWEKMTRRWAVDIAIATIARDAVHLFDQYWSLQNQTALIFEEGIDARPAIDVLRRSRDWRRQALPPGVLFLLAPAVDGDGILIAARDEAQIDATLAKFADCCRKTGVPVPERNPP